LADDADASGQMTNRYFLRALGYTQLHEYCPQPNVTAIAIIFNMPKHINRKANHLKRQW
jgi:hypothetical protein